MRINTFLMCIFYCFFVQKKSPRYIIQPVIDSGDWNSTLWMVGGPIFFSLLALGIYESYRRRMASGALVMES